VNAIRVLLDARQRRQLLLVLIASIVAAAFELVGIGAIPAFVALLADPQPLFSLLPAGAAEWMRGQNPGRLTLFAAAFLAGVFVFKNAFLAALIHAEGRVLRDVTVSISGRLFKAYVYSPYTFHLQRNPAQLVNNLNNEVNGAIEVLGRVAMLVRESLVLSVVFVLLMMVDPLVSLAVFTLLGAVATAFYMMVRRSLLERGDLAQGHRGRQMQTITQALGAIKDAKMLGREPYLVDAVHAETSAMEGHELFRRALILMPRLFLEVMAVSAVLLVAVAFILLDRPMASILPVLALLAVAVVRMVPAFNNISASLVAIRYYLPSLRLTVRELETLEPGSDRGAAVSSTRGFSLEDSITLHDIRFRYPGTSTDTLQDISLTIKAREAVAFVGPSGAGKSTLVDVLLGLLTPSTGTVRVDGRDIQENVTAWQRQIGYIPQDIYLLDDSLRRNIAFGLPDSEISEVDVARALAAAQLDGFVATLPDGLDTTVGNRGIRLSGGQRQRVGIARALYHNPSVLVMDEATSALDNETERDVIEAINRLRGDRTFIIIAHRLTTVQSCDRLFLINDGKLEDQGSYSDLGLRHHELQVPEPMFTRPA
jgi:ATP-binding cassette, subfamily B, bacterial PglK